MQDIQVQTTPELDEMENQAEQVLYKARTVFPFTFFPTEIIVDKIKITIKRTGLPGMVELFPIRFENLVTVTVSTAIFFGNLTFDLTNYEKNPGPVKFLPIKKALTLQKLLTGMVYLRKSGVDTNEATDKELFDKAINIGSGHQ